MNQDLWQIGKLYSAYVIRFAQANATLHALDKHNSL